MAAQWNERFLSSTRGRIVALLRRASRTVEELAQTLGLTDNAIRAQLATMERDGLVRQRGSRRGIRKPSYAYELDPQAERLFAKPYPVALSALLSIAVERFGREEAASMIRDVGTRLAIANTSGRRSETLVQRLEAVVDLINQLGGLAELDRHDSRYTIHGYDCLFRAVVPEHPEICELARALIAEYAGVPVEECCERGGSIHCRFEILDSDPSTRSAALSGPDEAA